MVKNDEPKVEKKEGTKKDSTAQTVNVLQPEDKQTVSGLPADRTIIIVLTIVVIVLFVWIAWLTARVHDLNHHDDYYRYQDMMYDRQNSNPDYRSGGWQFR